MVTILLVTILRVWPCTVAWQPYSAPKKFQPRTKIQRYQAARWRNLKNAAFIINIYIDETISNYYYEFGNRKISLGLHFQNGLPTVYPHCTHSVPNGASKVGTRTEPCQRRQPWPCACACGLLRREVQPGAKQGKIFWRDRPCHPALQVDVLKEYLIR